MTNEIETDFIEFYDDPEVAALMRPYDKKIANTKSLKEMRRMGLTVQAGPPMPRLYKSLPGQQELF